MPPFWQFLTRRWLGLSPDLAYTWWHALSRSRWSETRTFYQAVLRFDQHPAPAQRPSADKLAMSGLVTPQDLIPLVENLVHERCRWCDGHLPGEAHAGGGLVAHAHAPRSRDPRARPGALHTA
jgi:hypothetical protein